MEWIFEGDRPIWIQLVEQLRQRIVTGVYPPGERIPAVRELAEDAGVNPNTMQRAMSLLESEGIIATNRTSGRVVTNNEEILKSVRMKIAQEKIEEFIKNMGVLGFNFIDIKQLLEEREVK